MSAGAASSWPRVLALALFVLSLGMVAFALASLVVPGAEALPSRPTLITVLVVTCVLLSYPLVGTLVAIRRPENRIGWLFIVLGLGFAAGYFSTEYVGRAQISGWPLPGAVLVGWVGNWSFVAEHGDRVRVDPPAVSHGSPARAPLAVRRRWALVITMALGVASVALRPGPLDATTLRRPRKSIRRPRIGEHPLDHRCHLLPGDRDPGHDLHRLARRPVPGRLGSRTPADQVAPARDGVVHRRPGGRARIPG